MSKTKWLVLMVVFMAMLCVAAAQKPQAQPASLPGRVPMHSQLLAPSAEWNAYYDIVPEGERSLYWTTVKLIEVARSQAQNIQQLDQRLKALEAKVKAVEPNAPADPNGK
jgi:TolA-binding protein